MSADPMSPAAEKSGDRRSAADKGERAADSPAFSNAAQDDVCGYLQAQPIRPLPVRARDQFNAEKVLEDKSGPWFRCPSVTEGLSATSSVV